MSETRKAVGSLIGRERFMGKAAALAVIVGGRSLAAAPKLFSTGSFGWHANTRMIITVDGMPMQCSVNVCITVQGSKEAQ